MTATDPGHGGNAGLCTEDHICPACEVGGVCVDLFEHPICGTVACCADEKPAVEHGTLSAYAHHRCRCAVCRSAWAAYMRWWRVEQRGRVHACPTCTCPMPPRPGSGESR